jgi:light-regulated signal transduction histidine kinase (bacteriophytochrome)
VAENGIGIRAEYNERILGLFKRLHSREVLGTGIGLALVRKMVEQHGGTIEVDSDEAGGATFVFTLTVAESRHAQAAGPA